MWDIFNFLPFSRRLCLVHSGNFDFNSKIWQLSWPWSYIKKLKLILKKIPLCSEMNRDKTPIFWLHCERCMNSSFAPKADCVLYVVSQWVEINSEGAFLYLLAFSLVYDRNYYLGLGLIPKPKLTNTFGRYSNRYPNHRENLVTNSMGYCFHLKTGL